MINYTRRDYCNLYIIIIHVRYITHTANPQKSISVKTYRNHYVFFIIIKALARKRRRIVCNARVFKTQLFDRATGISCTVLYDFNHRKKKKKKMLDFFAPADSPMF